MRKAFSVQMNNCLIRGVDTCLCWMVKFMERRSWWTWYPPLHGWYSHKEVEEEASSTGLYKIYFQGRECCIFHCTVQKIRFIYSQNETVRPRSQFLHSCICKRFVLYIPRIGLPTWLKQNRQTDPGNLSQIHEWGNWETEQYTVIMF
jgi:hypothetical protein